MIMIRKFEKIQSVMEVAHELLSLLIKTQFDMTQLLLLGKFEYTGGPIFKVVLEC